MYLKEKANARDRQTDYKKRRKKIQLQRKCYVLARAMDDLSISVVLFFFPLHTHLLRCFALLFFLLLIAHSLAVHTLNVRTHRNQKELTSTQRLEHITKQWNRRVKKSTEYDRE